MSEKKFLITEDGSHTIFIPELDETYHSTHGAIQESTYVFIEQGIAFQQSRKSHEKIRVFEVGFGTGLNALLSALFAEEHQLVIEYDTIEAFPLELAEIEKLNYQQLIDNNLVVDFFNKIHECQWEKLMGISTYFLLKKIKKALQNHELHEKYDICFFDAFAPSKQAEMWEKDVLEKVYNGLIKGGLFVTYCAKGQLKRDLKSIGYEVETLPGPPGKNEMVRAIKI